MSVSSNAKLEMIIVTFLPEKYRGLSELIFVQQRLRMVFSILLLQGSCLSLHDFPPIYLNAMINIRTTNEKLQLLYTGVT